MSQSQVKKCLIIQEQKMSKFSKLCSNQKINGDVEQVPEYSDEDLKLAEK